MRHFVQSAMVCARIALVLLLLTGLVGVSRTVARADESSDLEESDNSMRVPSNPPRRKAPGGSDPGLDALLRLPSGYGKAAGSPVAGAGEAEWRRRFADARSELGEARESLAKTKKELDELAGAGGSSAYSVAPPGIGGGSGGASPANQPLSFKLRQELKRDRENLDTAEKALRELRIEADLAGVPESWRVGEESAEPQSSGN